MNKLIFYFLITTSIVLGADWDQQHYEQLQPIIEFARAYRIGAIQGENAQKALLKSMVSQLPVYDSQESFEQGIQSFLQDQLGDKLPPFNVVSIADTDLSGHSIDPVFFIMDENRLILVVKAFQKPQDLKSKFLREISSLDFLQSHSELGIGSPYPVAVGQIRFEGITYGLLAESVAKGDRLDALVKALRQANDEEYDQKYQRLQEAFKVSALSMAKLNDENLEKGKIAPKKIEKMRTRVKALLNSPSRALIADEISAEELQIFVEELIQQVQKTNFIRGYSHYSAHLANVFYDSNEKRISYIDVAKMFDSYDHQGRTLSFSAYDVVRYLHSFCKYACPFMEFETMRSLMEEFKQTYYVATKDPTAYQLVQYLEVESAIGRLLSYGDYERIPNQNQREFHRRLFEIAKKTLLCEMKRPSAVPVQSINFGMIVDPVTGIAHCVDVNTRK